ncbi:mechanosensitive ion channel, partial [Bacillus inaquosorum]|nr:mechanosensitive ion channel [Bacillus inaquosorum]
DSYYNLFFNFYTKTTVWAENLDIREDINYKIIEILGAEGVEFAYPGQMVVVKQKHQNDPFQVNLNKEEKERA